ncbi:zinc finger BED domain-containing protein RICESLEEPER 2-like protein [Tanacetum coccineum]|uniref:Zinc finger BED domain-containing protein RICESLEEPER 2-like protein n=1 Tax=Tanacetum coccineum TaxID=301880 RepID=A0ABQ4WAJ4_9ASTR
MDQGDDLEDASSSTTSKHFSNVWEYFEIIPVRPDGIKRATCTHSNKVLLYEHETSNIRRHICKCFGVDLSNKADAPPPKRICLDQAKFKEKLAISIIKHNYPFTYVEHEGTRDLHKFLHPDANPKCRNTVKKEVLRIYEREKLKTCPTEEEWTRIEAIAMFLKLFYDITKLFSRTLYSTSNLYFHNVYKNQKSIQRHMFNPDPVVSGMAKDMKTKFDKYWETYTMVLSFGAILDPRYKLNIIEFYLSKLGMEGQLLIEKVQSVEDGLRKLYSAYEIQPNVMHGSTKGPSLNVGGGKLCDDAEDVLAGFETFQTIAAAEARAAEEKKEDKEENDDDMGFSLID